MHEQMMVELMPRIDLLATKLGTSADMVFSWYVKQEFINFWLQLSCALIFAVVTVFAITMLKKATKTVKESKNIIKHAQTAFSNCDGKDNKKYKAELAEAKEVGEACDCAEFRWMVINIVSAIIFIGFTTKSVVNAISLLNVEYHAFKEIIDTIAKLTIN